MKIVFEVRFHTRPGQDLFLTGAHSLFGGNDFEKSVPLSFKDAQTWTTELAIPDEQTPDQDLVYNYALREPDGTILTDWGVHHKINPSRFRGRSVLLIDSWNYAGYFHNAFYTEPFQRVLLKGMQTILEPVGPAGTHTPAPGNSLDCEFTVSAPLLHADETLCLVGSSAALGNWSVSNPLLMGRHPEDPACRVSLSLSTFPLEYKYGVFNVREKRFVRFEEGSNRVLHRPSQDVSEVLVRDGFANLPVTAWKGAGVATPVFSLRSNRSFGVGEFSDLPLLVDWCAATGLQLIQILPVNDTSATHTWRDSYPYSAISAFALHPIYLRLDEIATRPESKSALEKLKAERERLNGLADLDYEAVAQAKKVFVAAIFPFEREATAKSKEYKDFVSQNQSWLAPYALFCCLRDKFHTSDFKLWPSHGRYDERETEQLAGTPEFRDHIEAVYFTQFHLDKQLRAAAAYAHSRGVVLKGDIPIGIYRYGADAWQAPELYHMEMQAGAPPDAFAVKGQNWGFPTYDWPRMQQDGFNWWKQRFGQMSRSFDAFRIDHILGFFRIWSIPMDAVEGILGYFVPALPVRGSEFAARGIPFERSRFVEPYITDEILIEIFGDDADEVRKRFIETDHFGRYSLKEGARTQREVQAAFPGEDRRSAKLRQGLFDLISNVLLFDMDPEGDEFHFRFAIQDTLSFKALPSDAQWKLKELYVDYFFRRQDDFWRREALKKLPALKRVTNMLVCGEDLGLVPACVPQVMRDLGLLSLEIQRMPKDMGAEFFRPKDAPYLSVVTPSTHDMSTIRGWWREDRAVTQRFYNNEMGITGPAPDECEPGVCKAIIQQHLQSPAMWSIFLLQDLLGMDAHLRNPDADSERINVPAIPQFYWRYRMHVPLETLLEQVQFNAELAEMVRSTGRAAVT